MSPVSERGVGLSYKRECQDISPKKVFNRVGQTSSNATAQMLRKGLTLPPHAPANANGMKFSTVGSEVLSNCPPAISVLTLACDRDVDVTVTAWVDHPPLSYLAQE